jgi:CRISPR-associated protein Cas2
MENKHWLILYDIKNEKRLVKVAKLLESYAVRVQKSVFEITAPNSIIICLKNKIEKVIELEYDFVLFFEICEKDWQKQQLYGINKNFETEDTKFKIL